MWPLHLDPDVDRQRALLWRRNERDGVSNHQRFDCQLSRLFRRRSKKTSKLSVTGLCAGNSPVTGELPTQRDSNAENVSIWWRHHTWASGGVCTAMIGQDDVLWVSTRTRTFSWTLFMHFKWTMILTMTSLLLIWHICGLFTLRSIYMWRFISMLYQRYTHEDRVTHTCRTCGSDHGFSPNVGLSLIKSLGTNFRQNYIKIQ